MKEIMHVSQSEQQPQRPVLHLSDMLADVGSASPRAEEERSTHSSNSSVMSQSSIPRQQSQRSLPREGSLRHVIRRVLASGFLLKVDFRRFV